MELDDRSVAEPDCLKVKVELEEVIWKYMNEYELPDKPTTYDFLLMSLNRVYLKSQNANYFDKSQEHEGTVLLRSTKW